MKLAYVDSSVWITRFEGLKEYRPIIDAKLTELAQDGWSFVVSEAVALEVLIKPYKNEEKPPLPSPSTSIECVSS